MLEFARQQWLWLFVLVGAFFVAWRLARRYRKQRVTYGVVWRRVAKRVLPPAWKRILRTALTLLISGVMLSAVVLYASGLQRPTDEKPAPLIVAIVIDNSPAMRAGDARQNAQQRAQTIVDSLGEDDRALLCWFDRGRPMIGPWLKSGDNVSEPPATDFTRPDMGALASRLRGLSPPPDVPEVPVPVPVAFWVGDTAPDLPTTNAPQRFADTGVWLDLGAPMKFVPVELPRRNDAVVEAAYTPPQPGDAHAGVIEARTLSGADPVTTFNGIDAEALTGPRVVLPFSNRPCDVKVSASGAPDGLPLDDSVSMNLNPRSLSTVVLCYPGADDEPNPFFVETLKTLLPGREIKTRADPKEVAGDLVVLDRALPQTIDARFLLCFGVVPPEFGAIGEPVRADPNMQLRVDPPEDLEFEAPDLTLLSARQAVPLTETTLQALVKHIEGGVLIATRRGAPEVLYSGFIPHESTLLRDQSGFLLLLRWLKSVQSNQQNRLPPFVQSDKETPFQLDHSAALSVELAESPWLPAFGARSFTLTTTADGRARLGPFEIPGEYVVREDGREIGRFTAIWTNAPEQTLPKPGYENATQVSLGPVARKPDWRDNLPGLLLWIAFAGLVIEWLFWLTGLTE